MSILTVASGQSVYRGYEYSQAKKVQRLERVGEGIIRAVVKGNGGSTYDTRIDIAHPRKSQCNCPHAAGKRIVCKHMVAVYFTAFPAEAKQDMEDRLVRYVGKMKKSELQEALLQLLFDGPEWQYDRFIEEKLGE